MYSIFFVILSVISLVARTYAPLCQAMPAFSLPPLPLLSAIVSICLAPPPPFSSIFSILQQTCNKTTFFTQILFQLKIFYPKKCVNYNKLKLQQNRVKGPKYPNCAKKMTNSCIKFQNLPKKMPLKSAKQPNILQRFYPR